MKKNFFNINNNIFNFTVFGIILFLLFNLSHVLNIYNYFFLHVFMGILASSLALAIFLLTWNSKKYFDNDFFTLIGISFLFVAFTDLIHSISNVGLNINIVKSVNIYAQLWLTGRFIQSISILVAFAYLSGKRRLNIPIAFLVISIITAVAEYAIIYRTLFNNYIIICEYIISIIFLINIFLVIKFKNSFEQKIHKLLVYSFVFAILSEIFLINYAYTLNIYNLEEQFFNLISFYFLNLAIVEKGIKNPQDSIFRKLTLEQKSQRIKEKQILERERALREIVSALGNTLDINIIKTTLVTKVGKYFEADRCFIVEYDEFTGQPLLIDEPSLYLSSPKTSSNIGYDYGQDPYKPLTIMLRDEKTNIYFTDVDKFIEENPDLSPFLFKHYKDNNVKAICAIPIAYLDKGIGTLIINFDHKIDALSQDDINFFNVVTDQAGIAISNARVYKQLKQQVERENILRNIITTIRSTLDINMIKKSIVSEVGKALDADRVFIVEFDPETNNPAKILDEYSEYLSSPELASCVGFDFASLKLFTGVHKELKPIIIKDIEEFKKVNDLENTPEEKWLEEMQFKTGIAMVIFYGEEIYGVMAMHYTKSAITVTDEHIKFLRTLVDQTGIALYQAKLYEKEKKAVEREVLLKKITELIRGSLDIEETLNIICEKTAKLYKVQRSAIAIFYNQQNYEDYVIRKEYTDLPELKGFKDIKNPEKIAAYWGESLLSKENVMAIDNINLSDTPDYFKNDYILIGIKSVIGTSIRKGDNIWGTLVLSEYNNYRHWTEDDKELLSTIADQVYMAINQAELYSTTKQYAKKEELLKEILSEIKLTTSLEKVYNYLLSKLSEVFNVDRALFIEVSEFDSQKHVIKYEFHIKPNIPLLKNIVLTKSFSNMLFEIINSQNITAIDDVKTYQSENREMQKLFQNYNIKSILASPLIKYNKEKTIFGGFLLCTGEQRIWKQNEIDLIEEILRFSVIVIWEIIKRNELDELRNTFILTLAHDLEVPLVGERRALEFILTIPPGELLDKYKDIISEVIKDNINLSIFLKRLVDSYNYELGRKYIFLALINLTNLIKSAIDSQKKLAVSKSVSIITNIEENLPNVNIDQNEIKKVLNTLIENAIIHSPRNSDIEINCNLLEKYILVSIIDNGQGIQKEVQKRLFKRYETAVAMERKIGSGLGLYLAKQIIEAHGGKIWFITKEEVGTTFSFTLPLISES